MFYRLKLTQGKSRRDVNSCKGIFSLLNDDYKMFEEITNRNHLTLISDPLLNFHSVLYTKNVVSW